MKHKFKKQLLPYPKGYWVKHWFNPDGNISQGKDSVGNWYRRTYHNDKATEGSNSDGYWFKKEYDNVTGKLIYYENTSGIIIDLRDNYIQEQNNEEDEMPSWLK